MRAGGTHAGRSSEGNRCIPAGPFCAVVIGGSSGGLDALGKELSMLPEGYSLPVLSLEDMGRYLIELERRGALGLQLPARGKEGR